MTPPASHLSIRSATESDSAVLARLNQQLIQDQGHRNSMSLSELQTRMESWMSGEYSAIIAHHGEEVLGYCLYRVTAECVCLRQLYVCLEARRQGVGRALVDWVIEHLDQSATRLRIDVLIGNNKGIDFWHALGFEDYCLTMERAVES